MPHSRLANGTVFAVSVLHPDDTTDPVNVASVLPGLEAPLDNTQFLRLQDTPELDAAALAAIVAPPNGLVRTLVVSGRKHGRFTFRAGVMSVGAGAVANSSFVTAADLSGTWFSEAHAGLSVGGLPAMTNASRNMIMPVDTPTFVTAKRVSVAVPLSAMILGNSSTGLPTIDGVEFAFRNPVSTGFPMIVGVCAQSSYAQSEGFRFRVRLPRGSFAGVSIVASLNGTGANPHSGTLTRPVQVLVWETPTNFSLSAAAVSTYPAAGFNLDPASPRLKWTGYCGLNGNPMTPIFASMDSGRPTHERAVAQLNFVSGTSTSNMSGTGAGAAFNVNEECEYFIQVFPAELSGASWYVTGSSQTILFKLEVWIDVTSLGTI